MNYKKGDICICTWGGEFGMGYKSRPVVFWDDLAIAIKRPTFMIIPITTTLAKIRYEPSLELKKNSLNGLFDDGILKVYQLACISKNLLGRVIGKLSEDEKNRVIQLLKIDFPIHQK